MSKLVIPSLTILFVLIFAPSSALGKDCPKCWYPNEITRGEVYTYIDSDFPDKPTEIHVGAGVVNALKSLNIGFDQENLGAHIIYYNPDGIEKATACITGTPPDNINKKTTFFIGKNGQVFVRTIEYSGDSYLYKIVPNNPYFITIE